MCVCYCARARSVCLACTVAVCFDVIGEGRGLRARQRVLRHAGGKLVARVCILEPGPDVNALTPWLVAADSAAAAAVVVHCQQQQQQQQQEGRTRREDTKRKDRDAERKCRSSASRSSLPLVARTSSATRVDLFLRVSLDINTTIHDEEEKVGRR